MELHLSMALKLRGDVKKALSHFESQRFTTSLHITSEKETDSNSSIFAEETKSSILQKSCTSDELLVKYLAYIQALNTLESAIAEQNGISTGILSTIRNTRNASNILTNLRDNITSNISRRVSSEVNPVTGEESVIKVKTYLNMDNLNKTILSYNQTLRALETTLNQVNAEQKIDIPTDVYNTLEELASSY